MSDENDIMAGLADLTEMADAKKPKASVVDNAKKQADAPEPEAESESEKTEIVTQDVPAESHGLASTDTTTTTTTTIDPGKDKGKDKGSQSQPVTMVTVSNQLDLIFEKLKNAEKADKIEKIELDEERLLEMVTNKLFDASTRVHLTGAALVGLAVGFAFFALGMGYGVILAAGKYPYWYLPGKENTLAKLFIPIVAAPAGILILPVISGLFLLTARELHGQKGQKEQKESKDKGRMVTICIIASAAFALLSIIAPFAV
jgi:hypothetical protein